MKRPVMTKFIIPFLFILSITTWGGAQVYPGDADNNGVVDNIDILYIGYAFGNIGPSRLDSTDIFVSQEILLEWANFFPEGPNFVHADANGDGLIDYLDFLTVLSNYQAETDNVQPTFFIEGVRGIDPILDLDGTLVLGPVTENSVVTLPITLGSEEFPLTDLSGIAFSFSYDPRIIKEISFDFSDNWMGIGDSLFTFVSAFPSAQETTIDLALTRYGGSKVSGWGEIGKVSFVIQDNLGDFIQEFQDSIDSVIEIEEVLAIDDDFNLIPVVSDSLHFMIYDPKLITNIKDPYLSENIHVYPNPVKGSLNIRSAFDLQLIEVIDMHGRQVKRFHPIDKSDQINLADLSNGVYGLRIYSSEGILTRKILIQRE